MLAGERGQSETQSVTLVNVDSQNEGVEVGGGRCLRGLGVWDVIFRFPVQGQVVNSNPVLFALAKGTQHHHSVHTQFFDVHLL